MFVEYVNKQCPVGPAATGPVVPAPVPLNYDNVWGNTIHMNIPVV